MNAPLPPGQGLRPQTGWNWGFGLVLAVYLALATSYSLTVPLFEAPDEDHHFHFIRHLAAGRGLPVMDASDPGLLGQEAGQPPLYYALGALLVGGIDAGEARLGPNPHANLGQPLQPGNKNRYIHTGAERWPWQGLALAVHLARLYSVALGACTVYVLYRLGLLFFVERPYLALAAAAFTASLPQFLFVHAAVTNDALIVFLATLALWQMMRACQEGCTRPLPNREVVALGLTLGLAAITKLSGLGLLAVAAATFGLRGWATGRWRQAQAQLALALLLAAAVAGWWYVRNWQLYGDPTGLGVFLQIVGPRPEPLTLRGLAVEVQGMRISLLGLFGWFNLALPGWVYRIWDVFLLAAAAGLVWRVRRGLRPGAADPVSAGRRAGGLLLGLWLVISLLSLWRWTALTPGAQGRLLFPAIASIAMLLASGWDAWLPGRRLWLALPRLGLLALAVASLAFVIAPAYRPSPLLPVAAVPAAARIEPITFDDRVLLLGLQVEPESVRPGQDLEVILYWQALQPVPYDASLFLRLLGRELAVVAQLDSYPGWGALPTSQWPVGPAIVDRYRLHVPGGTQAPVLLRVDAGLYDYATRSDYAGRLPSGVSPPPGLRTVRLLPSGPAATAPAGAPAFRFENRIALREYPLAPVEARAGETLHLPLTWEALAPVGEDVQAFMHLVDASWRQVAGYDAPAGGEWWPSSAWEPGQTVNDSFPLALPTGLPPGEYTLIAGLYRLPGLERLEVSASVGQVRDRAALLTIVDIRP